MSFHHGRLRRNIFEDKQHGDYFYTINKTCPGVIYLNCKEKLLETCGATAKIVAGQFILNKTHNHPSDANLPIVYRFAKTLYESVTTSLRSCRVLYDMACEADPEGACLLPFAKIRTSLSSWRSKSSQPIPQTFEHYAELLGTEEWQRKFTYYGNQHLSVTSVVSTDGSSGVVFGDVEFLRSIPVVVRLYVDTTFKVYPRKPKVYQVLTIMVTIDDSILLISWAIMEKKTTVAYVSVLRHFSTVLAPHIRPISYMTDFEKALSDALQIIYPEAIAQRCYFHYCQALMKKAKKLHLLGLIQNCARTKEIFRKLMALALLPAHDILAGFNFIVTSIGTDIAEQLALLFNYFDTYWITTVTPEVFSVFGMETKTNNVIEAYHRVLGMRMGVHPSIWVFTEQIRQLQVTVQCSRASLEFALPIGRPSSEKNIIALQILQRAWQLYEERLLDIPRFLACASHFLKAFNHGNVITAVDDVGNFALRNNNEIIEFHLYLKNYL